MRVMVCCCCCCCSATAALLLSCGLPILSVLLLCVHSSSGRMGVGGSIVAEQRSSRVVVVGGMVVSAIPDTKTLSQGYFVSAPTRKLIKNLGLFDMSPTCRRHVADIPS